MVERLSIIDLSGGKASTGSFAGLVVNSVAGYAVDFRLDDFSFVELEPKVFSEGFDCSSCPVPMTDCVRSWAALSTMRERTVRWIPQSTLVYAPIDSRFCEVEGTDVCKIEDPILRSDSERDELIAGRSACLASMELASLLASFRTPRCFCEIRRNFGIFMSLLDQVDGGAIASRQPRGFYSVPAGTICVSVFPRTQNSSPHQISSSPSFCASF